MYRIWVGKRESDIQTYDFFDCSITFYGSNTNTNYSYCINKRIVSNNSTDFVNYVLKVLTPKIEENQDTEIHFYNNSFAYKLISIAPWISQYVVNLNSENILKLANHKALSRLWLSNTVQTPAYCLLSKKEISINNLQQKFGLFDSFVIQKNFSGGGLGTYILNKYNEKIILKSLKDEQIYLVSPYYYPNQSFSCHAMISNDSIAIFPISTQILYTNNEKIEYRGNDYICQQSSISFEIKQIASSICLRLQGIGYRGICGFDFIEYKNKILLIEINPRYQGSSYIINKVLKENEMLSLFEMNSLCFNNAFEKKIADSINALQINYKNRCIIFDTENDLKEARNSFNNKKLITFDDGFSCASTFEAGAYLLRYLFLAD